jgi:hypothetical protein
MDIPSLLTYARSNGLDARALAAETGLDKGLCASLLHFGA